LDELRGKILNRKFYDAHIHFFYDCPANELKHIFEALENIGLAGMDALVIAEFPPGIETVLKMIPGVYHPYVTPGTLENQKDPFPILNLTYEEHWGQTCLLLSCCNMACTFSTSLANLLPSFKYRVMTDGSLQRYPG